jgi:hypothetical protein
MSYLVMLNICVMAVTGQAQNSEQLGPDLIREHTTYFTLTDGGTFEQADSLLAMAEASQFLALGELHNRYQLSRFSEALLDTAASFGYRYFAVETGPVSAEKLEQLASEEGRQAVSDFYDEYSRGLLSIVPIPFFTGEADLDMLITAVDEGYDLWGIDQEYAFSTKYLVNELAEISETPLNEEQQELLRSLNRSMFWMYPRAQIFRSYDLSCTLKNSEELQAYLESFSEDDNREVAAIKDAIRTSLDIYCMYESGNYDDNNRTRIAYFKSNFDEQYSRAAETAMASEPDSLPRVILKMGSFHAGRERSPLNYYDIGNHLQTMADSLGTRSLHIRFLNRYIDGEDMTENENYQSSRRLASVGETDRWAMIDVRPIRRMLESGTLTANNFETREIINYDLILIMPDDRRVEEHW